MSVCEACMYEKKLYYEFILTNQFKILKYEATLMSNHTFTKKLKTPITNFSHFRFNLELT